MYLFRPTVFNCRQATLLSIKKAEGKITLVESLKLRYHLLYCSPCRRFIEQTKMLDAFGSELAKKLGDEPPFSLPAGRKQQIQELLDRWLEGRR